MKTFLLPLKALPAAILLVMSANLCAQTVQNFDAPGGAVYVPTNCGGDTILLPQVLPAEPPATGNFLRLASANQGVSNAITFERTNLGIFREIVAEFDFRMTPGDSANRADGMGFALLNTAYYNRSGPVCPDAVFEEPNFTGSLGLGFDIHKAFPAEPHDPNNNHISLHFDSKFITAFEVETASVDLASGEWIHARIIMRPGNGISDVSVILDSVTVIDRFHVSGFEPYESRVLFGARTGGEYADHDLDNINVQFSGVPDPDLYGEWSPVFDAEVIPIHTHLLPTGKVLYWENGGIGHHETNEVRLWDPATGAITTPALPEHDIFCTGHSFLADGRLFVTGGHNMEDVVGLPDAAIYDPFNDTWESVAPMNAGRWYPTNTTLGNGDVLVISGTDEFKNVNTLPQVWQAANGTWRDLTNAQDEEPNGGELYPRMFLTPRGEVFRVDLTSEGKTWFLNVEGAGAWRPGPQSHFIDVRSYGSAVMYDAGKILSLGGNIKPTRHAEIIDLNTAIPAWEEIAPMASPRRQFNAVILPDSKVFIVGGTRTEGFNDSSDAVYVAELWNPENKKWSNLAAMNVARLYHSVALLLPDGRVLAGGGGRPAPNGGPDRHDFEIFSPPYLFHGSRPVITHAPARASHGESFLIETAEAASIAKVNLIRLPSVTHAFDQNQRLTPLNFAQAEGGLRATVPLNPNLAPPGHYMLFIVNDGGVPAIAPIIQLVPNVTWLTAFNVAASNTAEFELEIGAGPKATDDFDANIDVVAAPPGFDYYAYLSIPNLPNFLSRDIRRWVEPFATELDWSLVITNAGGLRSRIAWDPQALPQQGCFTLRGGGLDLNLRATNEAFVEGNATLRISYRPQATTLFEFALPNGGWYLISLPVIPADSSLNALFPQAQAAYGWDFHNKQYVATTRLEPEKAYWISMPQAATIAVCGEPLPSYTRAYAERGWDLTGSVIEPGALVDHPAGGVLCMFGWDAAARKYHRVSPFVVKPTQGYWILVFQTPDTITVGSGGVMAQNDISALLSEQLDDMPPPPPFVTEVEEAHALPARFDLAQNYPNPFWSKATSRFAANAETVIEFQLPQASRVRLTVYDLTGREVRALVQGEKPAGLHRVQWDGQDAAGKSLHSGVYVYRLEAGAFVQTRKVVLLK